MLAVDDDEDALVALERVFRKYLPDVRLIRCQSGKAALGVLAKEKVDIAITDYRMPGMDGLEFLKAAHRSSPKLRSLMLTAFADPTLGERARMEGASLVISKPAEVGIIAGAIDFMLENPPEG